jgi:nicotinamidase-related amidase
MPRVTAEPYEYDFDPSTTALVVIDMQRDFVDPGGFGEALGNDVSLLRRALEPTRRVLDACRAAGISRRASVTWDRWAASWSAVNTGMTLSTR